MSTLWVTPGMKGSARLWHRGTISVRAEAEIPYLWMAPGRRGGEVVGMDGCYAETLACGFIGGFTGVITCAEELPPPMVFAEGKPSERVLCLKCVEADESIE